MGLLCWGDFEFSPKIRVCVRPCGGDFHFSCFFPCVCRGPVVETFVFFNFPCLGALWCRLSFFNVFPPCVWGPVAETLIFTFFSLCGDPVVEDFEFSRKNPYRVLCPVVETLIFLKKIL